MKQLKPTPRTSNTNIAPFFQETRWEKHTIPFLKGSYWRRLEKEADVKLPALKELLSNAEKESEMSRLDSIVPCISTQARFH